MKKKYNPMDELTEIANGLKDGGWTQREMEKEFRSMYDLSKEETKEFVKKIYANETHAQQGKERYKKEKISTHQKGKRG